MANPIRHTQLDGLRGFAAIAVVVFHSILDRDPTQDVRIVRPTVQSLHGFYTLLTKSVFVLLSGETAVVLFFVLSGAVLFESLRQRQDAAVTSAIGFPLRRFFRLYPVFFACLIACSAVMLLTGALASPLEHFWPNAALREFSLVGASWTLQVEFLAIPLILLSYWGYRRWGIAGIVAASVLVGTVLAVPELKVHLQYFHRFFSCFAVGLLIPTGLGSAVARWLRPAAFPVIFAAMLVVRHVLGMHWWSMDAQQALAALLIAQLYYRKAGRFGRFFDQPWPQYLGRLSYSVYLFNLIYLLLVEHFTAGSPTMKAHPLEWGLVMAVPVIAAAIPTAHGVEKYLERPSIALGRRLSQLFTFVPVQT